MFAALAMALLLAGASGGCYRPSAEQGGESAHTETVDQATFREVRDTIKAEGLEVQGRDILMYRESETRIRAESEFAAEDGKTYGTVTVEKQGDTWKIVGKK